MLLAFILLVISGRVIAGLQKTNYIIAAIIFWNLWSFASVEILSQLHLLTKAGIMFSWFFLDILLICLVGKVGLNKREDILLKKTFLKRKIDGSFIFFTIMGMGIITLSILTVPYNSDSMTYHLPRIAHWAQNQSVAHYAANDVRQIASPVLAEFINVQVFIVSGKKDSLLNLLQACSYIVDAYLVYAIAVKTGCKKRFAYLAVLTFMSMPVAFGEALNTQVDLFATIWMLIFTFYFLDMYEYNEIRFSKEVIMKCVIMAISMAFGYLAKPSVNIGMLLFVCILIVKYIRMKISWKDLFKIILCLLPVFSILLLPELLRNYNTFGALSDPSVGEKQLVGTLRPNYLMINMLKNFAYNWPDIHLYDSAKWMAEIVGIIADILRVNINDVSIAEHGMEYIMHQPPSYGHDTATNPVVLISATICFFWCVFHRRNEGDKGYIYSIWVMIIYVIFCSVVRWEPYVTRYMLSYLALLCPMIGLQAQDMTEKCKIESLRVAFVPIISFLCFTELFSLVRYHTEFCQHNASKRPWAYFVHSRGIEEDYYEVLDYIQENKYKNIGIKMGAGWEYPLWAQTGGNVRIENVMVENLTSKYMDEKFIPDCIIINENSQEQVIIVNSFKYEKAEIPFDSNELVMYCR